MEALIDQIESWEISCVRVRRIGEMPRRRDEIREEEESVVRKLPVVLRLVIFWTLVTGQTLDQKT